MTDTTTTEKRTVYIVETDHSDYAARGETRAGAVAAYRKGIRDAHRGIELLRKRGVPEAEIRDIWPDGVLQLPIKAIRREHTEVVTTRSVDYVAIPDDSALFGTNGKDQHNA